MWVDEPLQGLHLSPGGWGWLLEQVGQECAGPESALPVWWLVLWNVHGGAVRPGLAHKGTREKLEVPVAVCHRAVREGSLSFIVRVSDSRPSESWCCARDPGALSLPGDAWMSVWRGSSGWNCARGRWPSDSSCGGTPVDIYLGVCFRTQLHWESLVSLRPAASIGSWGKSHFSISKAPAFPRPV